MHSALPIRVNTPTYIRTLDLERDLGEVADLIELCFPLHLDPDGQSYVKEMRKSARDMRLLGWLGNLAEMGTSKVAGFVWEQDGHIIGNLSLIPFNFGGHYFHMIANVAVHPNHRGRGIAHQLTQNALAYLRRRNERQTWLQVRDDNPAAIRLYRSFGFEDRAVRTSWRIRPKDIQVSKKNLDERLHIRRRRKDDWEHQKAWLAQIYPIELRWNLPVNFQRFSPGFFQTAVNVLDGVFLKHWAVERHHKLEGVITWQKTSNFTNNVWMALSEETEGETLAGALADIRKRISGRHPITVDYPNERCKGQFEDLGFIPFRTLIWMACKL